MDDAGEVGELAEALLEVVADLPDLGDVGGEGGGEIPITVTIPMTQPLAATRSFAFLNAVILAGSSLCLSQAQMDL